ncbi:recQ-like DNA helicase blm-1 [Paramacrobiotus metropolitanus]|uniref:recQ-like DNA helicase blm-1 n=1 Tax=Paramacrobiotus metropolitanus TaxID=2943436 RepID=UPI002445DDC9|nr:recQ-like DNA helicase blm-1 [Paramacrobiotus metropolitanus]
MDAKLLNTIRGEIEAEVAKQVAKQLAAHQARIAALETEISLLKKRFTQENPSSSESIRKSSPAPWFSDTSPQLQDDDAFGHEIREESPDTANENNVWRQSDNDLLADFEDEMDYSEPAKPMMTSVLARPKSPLKPVQLSRANSDIHVSFGSTLSSTCTTWNRPVSTGSSKPDTNVSTNGTMSRMSYTSSGYASSFPSTVSSNNTNSTPISASDISDMPPTPHEEEWLPWDGMDGIDMNDYDGARFEPSSPAPNPPPPPLASVDRRLSVITLSESPLHRTPAPLSCKTIFVSPSPETSPQKPNGPAAVLPSPLSRPDTSVSVLNTSLLSQHGKFKGNFRDDGSSGRYEKDFSHTPKMRAVFKATFGLRTFRTNQLQAVNAACLGEDCFILMPTGGGKSLCYQLPALVSGGVTVVVSPLKSLIQDQVHHLSVLRINAKALSSDTPSGEQNEIYQDLNSPKPKIALLYLTPEKLSEKYGAKIRAALMTAHGNGQLTRFVIDEAHCVSQWGHDFRPEYKQLCGLRTLFPAVPMMALTATASPRVREDILKQLGMKNPKWFMQSFNRTNLKYEIQNKNPKAAFDQMVKLMQDEFKNASGIIYCLAQRDCETLANQLSNQGINAVPYHAGLDKDLRAETQRNWMRNTTRVVCATIAFGMGIDKPDVRFVFHYSIPKSVEGYYQETGRAGRDGKSATCILFYNYNDVSRHRKLVEKDKGGTAQTKQVHLDNLKRVVQFCETRADCRRTMLMEYFGEVFDRKLCAQSKYPCDNCEMQDRYHSKDVTEEAKKVIKCLMNYLGPRGSRPKSPLTLLQLVDIVRGSAAQGIMTKGLDRLDIYKLGASMSRAETDSFVRKLLLDDCLEEMPTTIQIKTGPMVVCYLGLGKNAADLLANKRKVVIHIEKPSTKQDVTAGVLTPEEQLNEECEAEIKLAMQEQATKHNYMSYKYVLPDGVITDLAANMPVTEEDMFLVEGMTDARATLAGPRLLEILKDFAKRRAELREQAIRTPVAPTKSGAKRRNDPAAPKPRPTVFLSDDEEDAENEEDRDVIPIDSDEEHAVSPYFDGNSKKRISQSDDEAPSAKKPRMRKARKPRAPRKPGSGSNNYHNFKKYGWKKKAVAEGAGSGGASNVKFCGRNGQGSLQRSGFSGTSGAPAVYNENAHQVSGAGMKKGGFPKAKSTGGAIGRIDNWMMPPP